MSIWRVNKNGGIAGTCNLFFAAIPKGTGSISKQKSGLNIPRTQDHCFVHKFSVVERTTSC